MQFEIYYKHSSCLTVKTCDVHYVDNRSMMCTNIIAVCCEKYIKHINTLLGEGGGGMQNFRMLNLLLHLVTAML